MDYSTLIVSNQKEESISEQGLKAVSHYNVLANVCRRMKNISSTLAYAEIELKNPEKAFL